MHWVLAHELGSDYDDDDWRWRKRRTASASHAATATAAAAAVAGVTVAGRSRSTTSSDLLSDRQRILFECWCNRQREERAREQSCKCSQSVSGQWIETDTEREGKASEGKKG